MFSLTVPSVIFVLLSLTYPFLQFLAAGFPGVSCGLSDQFRVHILLTWLLWAVVLYLSLVLYDYVKLIIADNYYITTNQVFKNYVETNQKFHSGSTRIIFAVLIPVFLWLAAGIITKSLHFFYDVNNGVFLALDICLMFRDNPEVNYLIMILVIFGFLRGQYLK